MNSVEIKNAIANMVKECRDIVDACKTDVREMTEEEKARFDELKAEIDAKKAELEKLQAELDALEIPTEEIEKKAEDEPKEEEKNNEERNMKENFSIVKELRKAYTTHKAVDVAVTKRATVDVATNGEHVVETDFWDILAPLHEENVLLKAGAKLHSGLKGNVQIPIFNGVSNVAWADETAKAGDATASFKHVSLTPKRICAKLPISLQFIEQDTLGNENYIREEIIKAISDKLVETLLGSGAGSGNTPAGLFNGRSPELTDDFKKVCALEAKLEAAKANEYKYILSSGAKADFRAMAKSAKSTQLVYEDGEIDGVETLRTGFIADKNYLVGDFSNLVIGQWGNINLKVVEDVASLENGCVTIVVNAYFDAQVARPDQIVAGKTGEAM